MGGGGESALALKPGVNSIQVMAPPLKRIMSTATSSTVATAVPARKPLDLVSPEAAAPVEILSRRL